MIAQNSCFVNKHPVHNSESIAWADSFHQCRFLCTDQLQVQGNSINFFRFYHSILSFHTVIKRLHFRNTRGEHLLAPLSLNLKPPSPCRFLIFLRRTYGRLAGCKKVGIFAVKPCRPTKKKPTKGGRERKGEQRGGNVE